MASALVAVPRPSGGDLLVTGGEDAAVIIWEPGVVAAGMPQPDVDIPRPLLSLERSIQQFFPDGAWLTGSSRRSFDNAMFALRTGHVPRREDLATLAAAMMEADDYDAVWEVQRLYEKAGGAGRIF